jgi:hypothetical protein
MACLPPTYVADKKCLDAEAPSVVERVMYADYDAFKAAVADANITKTENVLGGFAGTDPADKIFYPVATGMKFDIAPTATSVVTGAGMNKFGHTIVMQVSEHSAATDKQVSLFSQGRFVLVYELRGLKTANEGDRFKVLGADSGLTILDGGIVQNASADGGAALITFATNTEKGEFENWPRMSIASANVAAFLANAVVAIP